MAERLVLHNYTDDKTYRRCVELASEFPSFIGRDTWVQQFLWRLQTFKLKLLPEPMIRMDLTRAEFRNIGMMAPMPPPGERHLMHEPSYMVWERDYSYEEPNGLRADALEIDCFHPRLSLHYVDPDQGSYYRRGATDHQGSWLCT